MWNTVEYETTVKASFFFNINFSPFFNFSRLRAALLSWTICLTCCAFHVSASSSYFSCYYLKALGLRWSKKKKKDSRSFERRKMFLWQFYPHVLRRQKRKKIKKKTVLKLDRRLEQFRHRSCVKSRWKILILERSWCRVYLWDFYVYEHCRKNSKVIVVRPQAKVYGKFTTEDRNA